MTDCPCTLTKTKYGIPPASSVPQKSDVSPNKPLPSGESLKSTVTTGAKTLTYTQGSGSSTTTITTTIPYTSTVSETVYASNGAVVPSQTGSPENSPQGPGSSISPENGGSPNSPQSQGGNEANSPQSQGSNEANSPQSQGGSGGVTTTIQYTSTTTVYDQATGAAGAGGSQNSAEGNCAAPVTVTVTGPEETVTVVGTTFSFSTIRR